MSTLAPQAKYSTNDVSMPRYRYQQISLTNGQSSAVVFNPTSSTTVDFVLPTNTVFNLKRSYLEYQFTVPALASNYGIVNQDGFDFRTVQLGLAGTATLADIQNADTYSHCVKPMSTSKKDMANATLGSQFSRSNLAATSNLFPFSLDQQTTGAAYAANINYEEQQHITFSTATNTALAVSRQVFLGEALPDTIFGMDRDLVFPSDLWLRLQTTPAQRIMGYSTSNTAVNTSNLTQITTNVSASNVYLMLAVETNEDIRNALLQHMASDGLKFVFPFPYTNRYPLAGNSSAGTTLTTLTPGFGFGVKKIIWAAYAGNENNFSVSFDRSNRNGNKIQYYRTTLDTVALQNLPLQEYNPDDTISTLFTWTAGAQQTWNDTYQQLIQNYSKDSAYFDVINFQNNWVSQDTFGCLPSNPTNALLGGAENSIQYFDLQNSGTHQYSILATTPGLTNALSSNYTNGIVFYIFPIYLQHATVNKFGIRVGQ